MPPRPRSLRASRLPLKRSLRPRLEDLEIRLVLSTQQFSATPEYIIYNPPGGTASEGRLASVDGIPGPFASSMTPAEITSYYGANNITFGSGINAIRGDGAGQTIAIVDAYDDPALVDSTSAGFATSDLAEFDKYFGLPNPPSFEKYGETGSTTTLPAASPPGTYDVETALDVEWAHVMAPDASIDLVEATTSDFQTDMVAAIQEAASLPNVSVLSLSYGYPELPGSMNFNADFTTPAGHQGVTFVVATSDTGSFGQGGVDPFSGQPAFLPNVVSVGGTSLATSPNAPTLETAWQQGGGGISKYIPEPSYQDAVQDTGKRTAPDVSMDADPDFGGVAVYDSYGFGTQDPWNQIGGTSLATPLWAGLIAVADQGRVAAGGTTLDGPSQTLPALYNLPYQDFNDILAGDDEGNGATPGYDEVTGLGSPRADLLVPDLAAYDLASQPGTTSVNLTVEAPSTVDPGQSFGLSAAVQDSFGNTDAGFSGTATLTSSLSGVVATVPVTNGVAIFDGLTLDAGQSASYTVAITVNGTTEHSPPSNTVTGSTLTEPSGTEKLYPAPSFGSLSAALQTADSDSDGDITIVLEAGTYELNGTAASSLLIENTSGDPDLVKNITIEGSSSGTTTIVPSQPQGWAASIFEILGTATAQVNVTIKNLVIEGGEATTGGVLGGKAAVGGGILIDGGDVALSQVALVHDYAIGNAGTVGAAARRKLRGSTGGSGNPAAGGGLYMAGGKLSLNGVTFYGDIARGGRGGTGGVGGTDGGGGGSGGLGGSASGGGLYVATGTVAGSGDSFLSDVAVGGTGGYGGQGGLGGTPRGLGAGGNGGPAGMGAGGGLYVAGGSVTLGATPLTHDLAKGGRGGTGGQGGFSHPFTIFTFSSLTFFSSDFYGRGGQAGGGADAEGGGVYVGGGSLTLGVLGAATTAIQDDRALGGFFGFTGDLRFSGLAVGIKPGPNVQPGNPGIPVVAGNHGHHGATSSSGSFTSSSFQIGSASGGGIYIQGGSVTLFSQSVSNDVANFGGGILNAFGTMKASGLTMASDSAEVGGAIMNQGSLTVSTGVISNNKAARGVDGYSLGSSSEVGARGSTGGAIANYGFLGLKGVTISHNNAKVGGGIYSHSGTIAASALNVVKNSATTHGGGIYSIKGALTIDGGTVDNNTVSATGSSPSVAIGSGGGIDAVSDKVSLSGVTLSQNSARAGGGLYLASGSATIVNTDFSANVARQDGGAVYNDATLTIQGGGLTGNLAQINGGAIDDFASLTIDFATFSGNSAGADGGAINNAAEVKLDGVTITNNAATDLGGGFDNEGISTVIAGSITLNTAKDGGGVFDVGSMTISDGDVVSNNVATLDGGGFDLGSGGRINATGLVIQSNIAQTGDGGGVFEQRGALTIDGGEIGGVGVGNQAPASRFGDTLGDGGGIYDSGGKVTLSNTPIVDNTAVDGAGLYIATGSVSLLGNATLDDVPLNLISGNVATNFGGGIFSQGTLTLTSTTVELNVALQQSGGGIDNAGKLTITNSTLSANTATAGSGGDLFNAAAGAATITQSTVTLGAASSGGDAANAGSLTISTSTFSFGSASAKGGGLSNTGSGTLRLSNSTVADNSSTGDGGGIDNHATLDVVNATIAYNSVGPLGSGGGLDVESGTAGLFNTIVDLNATGGGFDVAGKLSLSSSNNLFGTLAQPLQGTTPNLVDVTNPLIGPLANNGGPTLTIALLGAGGQFSPAIDGGSNALALDPSSGKPLITDQRGALRGASGINAGSTVDIGAYEASSSYLVTSSADSSILAGTLRSGVEWAGGSSNDNPENIAHPAPNTVVFDNSGTFLTPQTITLSSTLTLPDTPVGVEILEPNSGIVTIKGDGGFQVIQVTGGSATLEGLTIMGGSAISGGGIGNAGDLTLNDITLMGNSASQGGGVYTSGAGSELTIIGGTIEDNTALGGAGVYSGGSLVVDGATIEGNSASEVGGGIEMPGGGTLTMSGSTISENSAASDGGGLFLGYVVANISGGSVSGNSATLGGGLYSGGTGSSLTITGTSLTGNSASTGGAIDAEGALTLAAASLSNNSASVGGAINNSGTNASITASSVTANSAAGDGGGINNSGTLTVSATTLSGNSAGVGGGIASQGTLIVGGSTFSGNTASVTGGGLFDVDGVGDAITNATFAGNSAAQAGGGIYASNSALTIVNSTIAYNTLGTADGGAGLTDGSVPINLYNTIVAGNTDTPGNTADDIAGTVAGLNNLVGTGGSGDLSAVGGNLVGVVDPGLAPGLANNGGPTQTIALVAGSPAIDAGSNALAVSPTTGDPIIADQRGAVRGNVGGLNAGNSVDIGSYEASSEYLVTIDADSNDLSTLRTGISWANVSTNANPANIDPSSPTDDAPNTVEFSAPETIDLSSALGPLVLSNTTTPVAIQGPGPGSATISGGGAVGVLQVMPGVTATLGSVVITDGSATTGAGINNAGSLTIAGSTITGNSASGSGGGISNAATGTLTLSGATVSGNTAQGSGGGISNAGNLQLNGITLSGNTASATGGGISDPGTLTLVASTISGNSAGTGGGIAASGMLADSGSTIMGNSATAAGGGIAVQAGGDVYLSATTVAGNAAGSVTLAGSGGGIANAGTLTLSYSTVGRATIGNQTIVGNMATGQGGGVDNEAGGTLTVAYSYLASNVAGTFDGGAIVNYGVATIAASTIAANVAHASGGGISTELGGTLNLSGSTLSGNSATSGGGGLANAGTTNVANATIAGNESGTGGGVYDTGVLTAINATIADNAVSAGGSAGGLDAVSGSTALFNTIVAQNSAGVNLPSDASGSLASVSEFDLFGTGGSGGLAPTALNGIQVGVKNPHLGALNSDGGPTLTIALLAGSPAIDAGSASIPNITAPTLDQRGALRGPAGLNAGSSPDIGAYEASSSYLVATTADSSNMGTLRSAIAWANVSTNDNPENLAPNATAPDTVVFDKSSTFSTLQTITISPTLGPINLDNTSPTGEEIDGTASSGLIISGGGKVQLFTVAPGSTATLTGVDLSGGFSATSGGAIVNMGSLAVENSTLSANSAADGGGAIDNLGALAIQSSTLNDNSAGEFGGGIDNESSGTLDLTNSTLAFNGAPQGGGIYSTGPLTAINATVAYNTSTAGGSGGGLDAAGGRATLYNTIVAQNFDTSGSNTADDIAGSVTGSYSLIGTGGSGGLVNGVDGNLVGVANPGLGTSLTSNGGPTQTLVLLANSPAIGTGSPTVDGQTIAQDQRGTSRGTTSIDIGSFELSSSYVVTSDADSTVPGTLRSAIVWADTNTGSGLTTPLVITFGSLFATPQVITLSLGTLDLTNTSRPIVIEGPGVASDVTIDGNGAIGVFSVASGATASFMNVTIAGGNAVAGGGINNAGSLGLSNVVMAFNSTPSGSGAAIDNTGALNVIGSSFSDNTGSYYGGAIFNDDGTATITDSNFVDNATLYGLGGAIDNLGGTLTVTGGTFQGNTSFQGGAIYNRNDSTTDPGTVLPATANLNGVTIIGNSAYQGGGLFNEGTMSVLDSTVAYNSAFQGGAASNDFGGTMTLVDSTLAGNTANQYGGAIDNVSNLSAVADTIAYNVVTPGGTGGGIDAFSGTVTLYDTIVALNTIGTGTAAVSDDITGQVATASSFNLIGTGGLVNGVDSNIVGAKNPGLAPDVNGNAGLANNGGPTLTIALVAGSPAIDAGTGTIAGVSIPGTDQRGVARPATGFDIGAYQGSIAAPTTTTPTPISTPTFSAAITTVSAASTAAVPAVLSAPVPAAATTAPVVSGASPFSGRHLHSRAHRPAKATNHHPAAVVHKTVRDAMPSRKAVVVRIAKKR